MGPCRYLLPPTTYLKTKLHSRPILLDDDDDNDDNFIAIYMYITRHTCNGMRFAPELLHGMPTIQSFHTYSTSLKLVPEDGGLVT